MVKPLPRLRLQGFNNLTKALSFNIYDVCYARTEEERQRYIEYIDEQYDADRLTQILTDVAEIIGANILNICLLYTSPSPRDRTRSRMPSSA